MHQFSQRDGRWAGQPLGTSVYTLGQAGCLVTAASSLLADLGASLDPGRLNDWLTANHGYVDDGLLLLDALTAWGARLAEWHACERVPALVARLAARLAAGAGVLVMVDSTPGGAVTTHWVRVATFTDDQREAQVMDPWQLPGQTSVALVRTYGAAGWDAARTTLLALVYERCQPVVTRAAVGAGLRWQAALCHRSGVRDEDAGSDG